MLSRYRRYAILIIVTMAAIVTPTTDAYTLGLMAGPLVILYEVSIILVRFFGKAERPRPPLHEQGGQDERDGAEQFDEDVQ
jgi:sec-independent protein translocase protein TatC